MKTTLFSQSGPLLLIGATLFAGAGQAAAQPSPLNADGGDAPTQPRIAIKWYTFDGDDGVTTATASRTARLQMAGMQAGFITNPLSIEPDPTDPIGTDSPDVLQFNFGNYNPYFDLRLPGDPGTVGYFKIHSQVQLIDAGTTSLCVNLQAYTPAGQEAGGLASGPTYLVPAVACFQDLGFGAALQGFFGQSIQATNHWTDLTPNFQYGMAVHYAVPGASVKAEQGLFLYLEAIGRYRTDPTQPSGHTAMWEFVPGLQMRLNDACWMSLGASRYNFLMCSWRY